MNVLGICHDVLICSACAVQDGQILAAMAEERLDRVKQSRVFPRLAIERCLELSELGISQVDEIAVAWNPTRELETVQPGYLLGRVMRSEHMMQVPGQLLRLSGGRAVNLPSLSNLWQDAPPVTFVDHHMAHLACGFYLSPFDEAAVLVLDGYGERTTGLLAKASGSRIEPLRLLHFPHSLGMFYGAVTQFLGFRQDSDEWKVMALAAYGDERGSLYDQMRQLVRHHKDGRISLDLDYFEFYTNAHRQWYSDRFTSEFGAARRPDEPLEQRHYDIAAALQRVFEESVTHLLVSLHELTRLQSLVLAGGSFMNAVYNGKVARCTPFEQCFVGGCPDDSGTSVGAALLLYAERTGRRPEPPSNNFWGSPCVERDCVDIVRKYKLPHRCISTDVADSAARDLAGGKLVGWYQGRSEFGQRALGNRSILADPRRSENRDVVNNAVKYRESFRPFAPAIVRERVTDYFECAPGTTVQYMEKVLSIRESVRGAIPAVVHVDGTGRLQTVDRDVSPLFHRLLMRFEEHAGVPVLLNTSFNLDGEPIVDSPTDAIRTFFASGLDVLYLGSVRIEKQS